MWFRRKPKYDPEVTASITRALEQQDRLLEQLKAIQAQRPITVFQQIDAEKTAREVARLQAMQGDA